MSFLSGLFDTGPQEDATRQAQQMLLMGYGVGSQNLASAKTNAQGYYDTAKGEYDTLQPGAQGAWDAYAKLVGAVPSAPGEQERILTSQPGFQTQMDLALQAANRTSAAGGMGASGNAIMAAMDTSRGLEEANIGNYAQRLLAMAGYAPQIAGARSNLDVGKAGIETSYGTQQANLAEQTATGMASSYQKLADAQTAAAKNIWDAVLGVAGLGIKGYSAMKTPTFTLPTAGSTG